MVKWRKPILKSRNIGGQQLMTAVPFLHQTTRRLTPWHADNQQ